ncbi:MAG: hypothetical protein HY342_09780 [Candidatus Lambdaproteobacteria bacterium]|nr:hypothetical protein [Candidatus Lambdaproteobacteria bacterium]
MKSEENKRKQKEEIERARRQFLANGGRVRHVDPADAGPLQDVKPRKQRLKMFA